MLFEPPEEPSEEDYNFDELVRRIKTTVPDDKSLQKWAVDDQALLAAWVLKQREFHQRADMLPPEEAAEQKAIAETNLKRIEKSPDLWNQATYGFAKMDYIQGYTTEEHKQQKINEGKPIITRDWKSPGMFGWDLPGGLKGFYLDEASRLISNLHSQVITGTAPMYHQMYSMAKQFATAPFYQSEKEVGDRIQRNRDKITAIQKELDTGIRITDKFVADPFMTTGGRRRKETKLSDKQKERIKNKLPELKAEITAMEEQLEIWKTGTTLEQSLRTQISGVRGQIDVAPQAELIRLRDKVLPELETLLESEIIRKNEIYGVSEDQIALDAAKNREWFEKNHMHAARHMKTVDSVLEWKETVDPEGKGGKALWAKDPFAAVGYYIGQGLPSVMMMGATGGAATALGLGSLGVRAAVGVSMGMTEGASIAAEIYDGHILNRRQILPEEFEDLRRRHTTDAFDLLALDYDVDRKDILDQYGIKMDEDGNYVPIEGMWMPPRNIIFDEKPLPSEEEMKNNINALMDETYDIRKDGTVWAKEYTHEEAFEKALSAYVLYGTISSVLEGLVPMAFWNRWYGAGGKKLLLGRATDIAKNAGAMNKIFKPSSAAFGRLMIGAASEPMTEMTQRMAQMQIQSFLETGTHSTWDQIKADNEFWESGKGAFWLQISTFGIMDATATYRQMRQFRGDTKWEEYLATMDNVFFKDTGAVNVGSIEKMQSMGLISEEEAATLIDPNTWKGRKNKIVNTIFDTAWDNATELAGQERLGKKGYLREQKKELKKDVAAQRREIKEKKEQEALEAIPLVAKGEKAPTFTEYIRSLLSPKKRAPIQLDRPPKKGEDKTGVLGHIFEHQGLKNAGEKLIKFFEESDAGTAKEALDGLSEEERNVVYEQVATQMRDKFGFQSKLLEFEGKVNESVVKEFIQQINEGKIEITEITEQPGISVEEKRAEMKWIGTESEISESQSALKQAFMRGFPKKEGGKRKAAEKEFDRLVGDIETRAEVAAEVAAAEQLQAQIAKQEMEKTEGEVGEEVERIEGEKRLEKLFDKPPKKDVTKGMPLSDKNKKRIISGKKKFDLRTDKQAKIIAKLGLKKVGDTATIEINGKTYYVTYRGKVSREDVGDIDSILENEGVKELKSTYKYIENFVLKGTKLHHYEITTSKEVAAAGKKVTKVRKIKKKVIKAKKLSDKERVKKEKEETGISVSGLIALAKKKLKELEFGLGSKKKPGAIEIWADELKRKKLSWKDLDDSFVQHLFYSWGQQLVKDNQPSQESARIAESNLAPSVIRKNMKTKLAYGKKLMKHYEASKAPTRVLARKKVTAKKRKVERVLKSKGGFILDEIPEDDMQSTIDEIIDVDLEAGKFYAETKFKKALKKHMPGLKQKEVYAYLYRYGLTLQRMHGHKEQAIAKKGKDGRNKAGVHWLTIKKIREKYGEKYEKVYKKYVPEEDITEGKEVDEGVSIEDKKVLEKFEEPGIDLKKKKLKKTLKRYLDIEKRVQFPSAKSRKEAHAIVDGEKVPLTEKQKDRIDKIREMSKSDVLLVSASGEADLRMLGVELVEQEEARKLAEAPKKEKPDEIPWESKEEHAISVGFDNWEHALHSINKRKREVYTGKGKAPQLSITRKAFGRLTKTEISEAAALSDTALANLAMLKEEEVRRQPTEKEEKQIDIADESGIMGMRQDGMVMTTGQREALGYVAELVDGMRSGAPPNNVSLAGFAGTGKTTIVENMIRYAESKGMPVTVLAPTNAAVRVLQKKLNKAGLPNIEAQTIHSAVMEIDPLTGKFRLAGDKKPLSGLVIIDEFSMVGQNLYANIMANASQGTGFVYIGDPYQLPPVNDKELPHLKKPTVLLDEVMRTAAESMVLKFATALRSLKRLVIPEESLGDVKVLPPGKADFDIKMANDYRQGKNSVIITYSNPNRHKYNMEVRSNLLYKNALEEGERLIAINNSGVYKNSEMFDVNEVVKIDEEPIFFDWVVNKGRKNERTVTIKSNIVDIKLLQPDGKVETESILLINNPQTSALHGVEILPLLSKEDIKRLEDKNIVSFDPEKKEKLQAKGYTGKMLGYTWHSMTATYGYAITAHKSQGSEFENVYIDDGGWYHASADQGRWFYTAVTRAQKQAFIVKREKITVGSDKVEVETISEEEIDEAAATYIPDEPSYRENRVNIIEEKATQLTKQKITRLAQKIADNRKLNFKALSSSEKQQVLLEADSDNVVATIQEYVENLFAFSTSFREGAPPSVSLEPKGKAEYIKFVKRYFDAWNESLPSNLKFDDSLIESALDAIRKMPEELLDGLRFYEATNTIKYQLAMLQMGRGGINFGYSGGSQSLTIDELTKQVNLKLDPRMTPIFMKHIKKEIEKTGFDMKRNDWIGFMSEVLDASSLRPGRIDFVDIVSAKMVEHNILPQLTNDDKMQIVKKAIDVSELSILHYFKSHKIDLDKVLATGRLGEIGMSMPGFGANDMPSRASDTFRLPVLDTPHHEALHHIFNLAKNSPQYKEMDTLAKKIINDPEFASIIDSLKRAYPVTDKASYNLLAEELMVRMIGIEMIGLEEYEKTLPTTIMPESSKQDIHLLIEKLIKERKTPKSYWSELKRIVYQILNGIRRLLGRTEINVPVVYSVATDYNLHMKKLYLKFLKDATNLKKKEWRYRMETVGLAGEEGYAILENKVDIDGPLIDDDDQEIDLAPSKIIQVKEIGITRMTSVWSYLTGTTISKTDMAGIFAEAREKELDDFLEYVSTKYWKGEPLKRAENMAARLLWHKSRSQILHATEDKIGRSYFDRMNMEDGELLERKDKKFSLNNGVNFVTGGLMPEAHMMNFLEQDDEDGFIYMPFSQIAELYDNPNYDEDEATKDPNYDVPRHRAKRVVESISRVNLSEWDSEFAEDYEIGRGEKVPLVTTIGPKAGGRAYYLFFRVPQSLIDNITDEASLERYLNEDVGKRFMTNKHVKMMLNYAKRRSEDNKYIWAQVAAKHLGQKKYKHNFYLMEATEKRGIQDNIDRRKLDFGEGFVAWGIEKLLGRKVRTMIVDSKEIKMEIDGIDIDLFYNDRYIGDGEIITGTEYLKGMGELLGTGDLYELKTVERFRTASGSNYFNGKGLLQGVEKNMVIKDKDDNLIARTVTNNKGDTYWVDNNGQHFDKLMTDNESKQQGGIFTKENNGFNRIIEVEEKSTRILQIPSRKSKDSAPFPFTLGELITDPSLLEDPDIKKGFDALEKRGIRIAKEYWDLLLEMRNNPEVLKREIERSIQEGEIPLESDRYIEMLKDGKGLMHPEIIRQVLPGIASRYIVNGAFKGKSTGNASIMAFKTDWKRSLKQGGVGVSARNDTFFNLVETKFREDATSSEIRTFETSKFKGKIDMLNDWLSSNEFMVMVDRVPTIAASSIIVRRLEKFHFGNHGDSIFFTPKDVFDYLQGDYDGDHGNLLYLGDDTDAKSIIKMMKKIEQQKMSINIDMFLGPNLKNEDGGNSPANFELDLDVQAGLLSAASSQATVTFMKMVRGVMQHKKIEFERGEHKYFVRNGTERVKMGYAPLNFDELVKDGRATSLLKDIYDRLDYIYDNKDDGRLTIEDVIRAAESKETKSLRLNTTSDYEMATLLQAAVDNPKKLLYQVWGWKGMPWLVQRLFVKDDGTAIEGDALKLLEKSVEHFNHGQFRQGRFFNENLDFGKLKDKSFDLSALNKLDNDQAAEYFKNRMLFEKKFRKDGKLIKMTIAWDNISLENRFSPMEAMLSSFHEVIDEATDQVDSRIGEEMGDTIFTFNDSTSKVIHFMALDSVRSKLKQIKKDFEEKHGVPLTSEDLEAGKEWVKEVGKEYRELFRIGEWKKKKAQQSVILPRFDYMQEIQDFTAKHKKSFDNLSEGARFASSLSYLQGQYIPLKIGQLGTGGTVKKAPRFLPLDLMSEDMVILYLEEWGDASVAEIKQSNIKSVRVFRALEKQLDSENKNIIESACKL